MNKTELVAKLAEKAETSKAKAERNLDVILEVITEELKNGNKVQLVGFGSFETRKRAPRKGRNPQTGEEIKVPASIAPVFKAGKALKDCVNE